MSKNDVRISSNVHQSTRTQYPQHRHSIPLDMDDIKADLDTPLKDACLAAKASVIVRTGYLDLSAGTGSYRVKEIMNRLGYALGVYVRADVNLTSIEASCSDGKDRVTEVVDLPTVGVNTERIWQMEHFADWITVSLGYEGEYHTEESLVNAQAQDYGFDNRSVNARQEHAHAPSNQSQKIQEITVREAHARLDAIEKKPRLYNPWMQAFGSAVACACFVFLLGGASYDIIGAFVGAGAGQLARSRLNARRLNQFVGVGLGVIIAALVTIATLRVIGFVDPSALGHDTAYIGAILFIVPGFPLITGGLDFAKLDFPSGLQRITYFLCIVGVGTLAAWVVASMVGLSPSGFESPQLPVALEISLIFITAIGGVWGFSVLFNSPWKMALVAGIIGACADTARLIMVNYFSMSLELAAFLGALIAGLLASAWRISVRHGYLPARLGFPRITLTVPAIVIMVPGLYMYRAVYELGNLHTVSALDWIFRAMLVIVGLPIGLACARILTDKSWRYDV
ncbi:threonine/serine exporter family protein [Alloscardovia theropitheci]|uniref:Threonine/serine exporter family protein n=1 Tax=Alloscardovia theropitheci TaxID=2496842 RepID=A0A4R0QPZ2_9BIFI|nr:threonine/serine exporter family protein [Alloscardovia theropitheci]TCD54334.1 threonine/serine exporter family protein [Alloscardovia theropitheci]